MGWLFVDALHDRLGSWPLSYIAYGGMEIGEIRAIAHEVGDGDDGRFYEVWMAAGQRMSVAATEAFAQGRTALASTLWLRASCAFATAYKPLYGAPVDERLRAGHARQMETFERAMGTRDAPVERLKIRCDGATLPAYFLSASAGRDEVRPLLILNNGYDATLTDLYFATAAAALQRGYHCLLFDGPGQCSTLIRDGVPMRADWEVVIGAVVDAASELQGVDTDRLALYGWSLGGYLAPRAAGHEPRLAACIADPGLYSISESFRDLAARLGADEVRAADLVNLDESLIERMSRVIEGDRILRWSLIQRGYWVHGVDNLRDYLRAAMPFTMEECAEKIACPTLITHAEHDPLARGAQRFFDRLRCPKTLLRFSAAEGAGDHCEMGNRTLLNRKVLDWLDDVLKFKSR